MASDDVYANVKAVQTIAPAAVRTNGVLNGTTVDRKIGRTVYRTAMIVVHTGVITDGTHTVNIQESTNGSAWTDVAAKYLQGAEPVIGLADDNAVFEIGYSGHKRYIRPVVTTAGATTGGFLDAIVLLGVQPVTRP